MAPIEHGTQHVFLTGVPGVGKTTAMRTVLRRLCDEGVFDVGAIRGFLTEECRGEEGRSGFDVVPVAQVVHAESSAAVAPLARLGTRKPTVGKYSVDVASFEGAALPELEPDVVIGARLLVLDEIGKMELLSRKFIPAVNEVLDNAKHLIVLGTVPMPRYGRTVMEVEAIKQRRNVQVVTVTRANREEVPPMLVQWLKEKLKSADR